MLVTDLIEGARFEAVKARDDATRDRFGEIVFRFYFGMVQHMGRVSGDPHPGNYLLLDDGRVGFLDFGLMRVLDRDYLERESAVAVAVEDGDADARARDPRRPRLPARPGGVRAARAAGADPGDGRLVHGAGRAPLHARPGWPS